MITNLWVVFLTGLTVGGLTCLAVQGGLLASVIATREDEVTTNKSKHALFTTSAFLVFKLIAYAILGFVLGAFGSALSISDGVQIFMQFVAGLYMIAVALNLLDIHPIFRYVIIQPPKFLTRLVHTQSKSKDLFAPALLGAMTVFIPCGTTLAMETLAISSANPLAGSAILVAYTLGTIPAFLGIGVVTSMLGETFKSKFFKVAAIAVVYLGFTSILGAFSAWGFTFNSEEKYQADKQEVTKNAEPTNQSIPAQQVTIKVTAYGYSPQYVYVKSGSPVTITLIGEDAYSCASAFRIPALGIKENLGPNDTATFTFTPTTKGKIPFSCSMGMYRGVIQVI